MRRCSLGKCEVLLITVATYNNYLLTDWKSSANNWNFNYQIIGLGNTWHGFETLYKIIIDFLMQPTIPNDLICCLVDCYDVIVAGPAYELITKFRQCKQKIVLGAENVCGPNCRPINFGRNVSSKTYVNTGFVMGTKNDLLLMYKKAFQLCSYDDQIGIAFFAEKNPRMCHLDEMQQFSLNLNYSYEIDKLVKLPSGRFFFTETRSVPVIIHMPFMYKDLGVRSNYVRSHALKAYVPISKIFFLLQLMHHMLKHATWNPVYVESYKDIALIFVAAILVLIFGILKTKIS